MRKSRKIVGIICVIIIAIVIGGVYYYKSKPVNLTDMQIKAASTVYSKYINSINSNNIKEFEKYSGNSLSFNDTKEFINRLDNGNKIEKFDLKRAYKKQGKINYVFENEFSNKKDMNIAITVKNSKVNNLNVF